MIMLLHRLKVTILGASKEAHNKSHIHKEIKNDGRDMNKVTECLKTDTYYNLRLPGILKLVR